MEQMYMIEIFVDKVTVFTNEDSSADKNLIMKIKFGPKAEFIIKEGQLIVSGDEKKDDTIEMTEAGRKQFTRQIRVGKSFLFPSYPDTILTTLAKFPLEIEVWNDDENETENKTFVGIGNMHWHTHFFHYLKETADAFKLHEPLSIKEVTTLYQECCCGQAGEITFILRLSALGDTIITEFQQQMSDPDKFCFRTNKAPSMFECKRVEGDDPNFCMVGSLYETTTLEDPDVTENAQKKIEVCTELKSCAVAGEVGETNICEQGADGKEKKYAIQKIRMGDIVGPCGNSNCPLAHKVRQYIRNLDSYKKKVGSLPAGANEGTKKICGTCVCKDDRWHREDCAKEAVPKKEPCAGCGGMAKAGETCEDKKKKHFGTGATPSNSPPHTPKSKTQAQYVTSLPDFLDAMFKQDFIVNDCFNTTYNSLERLTDVDSVSRTECTGNIGQSTSRKTVPGCGCDSTRPTSTKTSACTMGTTNVWVYNSTAAYSGCTDIPDDKDCKCNPPKPSPPCKTFDCSCIPETFNRASRKAHRAYCPLYKHKTNCPVTMINDEEEIKKDDEEEEAEPLPYGLPPVQLGPCPVMGRPCSVPDGFARMYKTAVQPQHPPSYSDAGKVCCSKEFQRIKKAIKEYMQNQKDHDLRCINKFNVDTEARCCDKEQVLKSLMGKECCGAHKLAIQDKYKEEKRPS